MTFINATESIVNPLQKSSLNKKGLCDYVVNVASGCLHGCTFCYVPSTPAIRARQTALNQRGVTNPQLDWGKYLFKRSEVPEKLDLILSRKKTWHYSPSGKGVVLLCSGTDPYQNQEVASLTRKSIEVLMKHHKRVRVLTRSPLWIKDIDLLKNPNITVGMSLPYLDDELSRKVEPAAPPPSARLKALLKASKSGCRLYIAIAPTPPQMGYKQFLQHLNQVMSFEPEVIFWEPINARGSNGRRMQDAGLDFVRSVMTRDTWASNFLSQWEYLERAATKVGCLDRIHIWVDAELESYVPASQLQSWYYRPTLERWPHNSTESLLPEEQHFDRDTPLPHSLAI